MNVRLVGEGEMGPKEATVAVTPALCVWSSLTLIVQLPLPTGVTVNVVLALPLPGLTVATLEGQLLVSSVKLPVYLDSLTVNVCAAPAPTSPNVSVVGEGTTAPNGPMVTLTGALTPPLTLSFIWN